MSVVEVKMKGSKDDYLVRFGNPVLEGVAWRMALGAWQGKFPVRKFAVLMGISKKAD